MSVVISRSLVLRFNPDVPGSSPAAPMIGWDNRVRRMSVTATSEMPNHPAVLMGNPSTAEFWSADSNADQTITAELEGGPVEISYVGLARHNFGSSQTNVRISCLVDGVWVQALMDFVPSNDSVLFARFEPLVASAVRLELLGSLAPARLAVLSAGPLLLLERNIYVGHTPIPMGREVRVSSGVSESGQFQGRIVMGSGYNTSVSLSHLTPRWYREKMDPFIEASAELPFFFAWRPDDYPLEAGYCWMKDAPQPSNQLNNGMMEVSFSMGGIVKRNSSILTLDPMRN